MKIRMKWILLFSGACLCSILALAQVNPPQLIIRGDDMGFSHSGNTALQICYESGIETTIEVLVPSPWFPEAVSMLRNMPDVDVGVHLTLTSEWDNVKWRPVSACPSLVTIDGYFYPFVLPNRNYPGQALLEHVIKIEDVEREFRAQIELAIRHIPQLSHVSAHMGCYNARKDLTELVNRLAKEYNIDINPEAYGVIQLGYGTPIEKWEDRKAAFISVLRGLKSGQKYMFVDHPGIDSPELRAIHHIGYENVAEDRQDVTELWTDQEIRDVIVQLGIKLIDYRDLKAR